MRKHYESPCSQLHHNNLDFHAPATSFYIMTFFGSQAMKYRIIWGARIFVHLFRGSSFIFVSQSFKCKGTGCQSSNAFKHQRPLWCFTLLRFLCINYRCLVRWSYFFPFLDIIRRGTYNMNPNPILGLVTLYPCFVNCIWYIISSCIF